MNRTQIKRFCHYQPASGIRPTFGVRFGRKYAYFFFTKSLQNILLQSEERANLPRGAQFVVVELTDKPLLTLRISRAEWMPFYMRLARRLHRWEHGAFNQRKRRVILQQQDYFHTLKDLRELWLIQSGCCYYTGVRFAARFDRKVFTVDHITPLARGGTDGPCNLALVHRLVNLQKKAKSKASFIKWLKLTKAQHARIKGIDKARMKLFRGVLRKKKSRR